MPTVRLIIKRIAQPAESDLPARVTWQTFDIEDERLFKFLDVSIADAEYNESEYGKETYIVAEVAGTILIR